MSNVLGFQFEPNRLSSSHSSGFRNFNENEGLNEEPEDSRLSSNTWCLCEQCSVMPTLKECLCCKEMDSVNALYNMESVTCITNHEDFYPIVLLKGNLWTSLVDDHVNFSRGLKKIDETPNRFMAYRHFCLWVHNRLGKDVRKVIPSCVVNRIRAVYPEPDGNYTGFKEGKRVQEIELSWN